MHVGLSPCESQSGLETVNTSTSKETNGAVITNTNTKDPSTANVKVSDNENNLTQTSSTSLGVGLDDLLQGITDDQVSELIYALNTESTIENVGVASSNSLKVMI